MALNLLINQYLKSKKINIIFKNKMIFDYLINLMKNNNKNYCFPHQITISKKTNSSLKTVYNAINYLKNNKIITIQKTIKGNLYYLHDNILNFLPSHLFLEGPTKKVLQKKETISDFMKMQKINHKHPIGSSDLCEFFTEITGGSCTIETKEKQNKINELYVFLPRKITDSYINNNIHMTDIDLINFRPNELCINFAKNNGIDEPKSRKKFIQYNLCKGTKFLDVMKAYMGWLRLELCKIGDKIINKTKTYIKNTYSNFNKYKNYISIPFTHDTSKTEDEVKKERDLAELDWKKQLSDMNTTEGELLNKAKSNYITRKWLKNIKSEKIL